MKIFLVLNFIVNLKTKIVMNNLNLKNMLYLLKNNPRLFILARHL